MPAAVASLVPLDAVEAPSNATLGLVQAHKQRAWLAVRLAQPVVVAGHVMLGGAEPTEPAAPGSARRLVVTRLFGIGQSTLLQMAAGLHANMGAAPVPLYKGLFTRGLPTLLFKHSQKS